MYKKVVVPLDGSAVAEGIVPFLLGIAGPLDLEVVLLRVVVPMVAPVVEASRYLEIEDPHARAAEAVGYLASIAAELTSRGIRVQTDVRRGDPVREILACAEDAGADLIAMTTHGRSGLGRLLFGSVAEAVLRNAGIPVLLMKQTSVPAPSERAKVSR